MTDVLKNFLISFFFLPLLGAEETYASFFGFVPPPCNVEDVFDEQHHQCYYCPRGSNLVEQECLGTPLLGDRCPHGEDHFYESLSQKCIYCQSGYIYLFSDGKCHKKD